MAYKQLSYEFPKTSPEREYYLYFPNSENAHPVAYTGRISIRLPENAPHLPSLGFIQAVFWQAMEYIGWDYTDNPVSSADANQVNFYLADRNKLAHLISAISLVNGYCHAHDIPVEINCFYANTPRETIRNTYTNVAQQNTHNLYLMQPDFMSAVRGSQHAEKAPFQRGGSLYRTGEVNHGMIRSEKILAKHNIQYFWERQMPIGKWDNPSFLEYMKLSSPIPIHEINQEYPRNSGVLLKIDMNNGSKRILEGEIPKYMTNGVVSNILEYIPEEGQHGDIHEEAYFGYFEWEAVREIFRDTCLIPAVLDMVSHYDYKIVIYPCNEPVAYVAYNTGYKTVSYQIDQTTEKGLETIAKHNGQHLAYIPPFPR